MLATVMTQQTIYIAFDNHQVAIHSNAAEVLSKLKSDFQQMLVAHSARTTVKHLEVHHKNGTYFVSANNKLQKEDNSLITVLRYLRDEVVLRLMQARPDLLWLHAGAAAYRGKAVLISGVSGRGKSTLVTKLSTHGWTYLSDDVLPLDPNLGKVMPFPEIPMVRQNAGQEISPAHLGTLRKTRIDLGPENVCRQATPISALILPAFNFNSQTRLEPCSPAAAVLEMLQNSLNFVHHREAAVDYLCQLAKQVPAFRLIFSDGNHAAKLITQAHQNWITQ